MKGKILWAGLLVTGMALGLGAPAQAQNGFGRGCVVREWATDRTPSYPVSGANECLGLDRQLDRNDGPDRGRVRAGFQNSPKPRRQPGRTD